MLVGPNKRYVHEVTSCSQSPCTLFLPPLLSLLPLIPLLLLLLLLPVLPLLITYGTTDRFHAKCRVCVEVHEIHHAIRLDVLGEHIGEEVTEVFQRSDAFWPMVGGVGSRGSKGGTGRVGK